MPLFVLNGKNTKGGWLNAQMWACDEQQAVEMTEAEYPGCRIDRINGKAYSPPKPPIVTGKHKKWH